MLQRISSAAVALIFLTSTAAAQDVECAQDFPSRCVTRLEAEEKAPFTGQLMTDDMAIFLGQSAESCAERISIEVAKTASVAEADRKRDLAIKDADLRVTEAERNAYKRAAERPLIEHPAIVASITAVAMVALYFAAVGTVKAGRSIAD